MGMASVFYDVLNYLVIDSCIHPSGYSERACASEHMQHATQNDLVIYDRGNNIVSFITFYESFVFSRIQKKLFCLI
jgi:hypothetical protein